MSKNWPEDMKSFNNKSPSWVNLGEHEVMIARPHNAEDVMFMYDDILFEIHKMTKGKNGRIFQVVAWLINSGEEQWLSPHPNGSIKPRKWKFTARTNGLVYFHNTEGLVELALSTLDNYQQDIIKFIMEYKWM